MKSYTGKTAELCKIIGQSNSVSCVKTMQVFTLCVLTSWIYFESLFPVAIIQ